MQNENLNKKTVALIILDGWGYREDPTYNAIAAAKKPNFDKLWATYPHALLEASGLAVGLPPGQMGNSEIGHTTIGAGAAIDTDLVRIGKDIASGTFGQNPAFVKLFDHVKKNNSVLHVQGLLGSGGVHSHSKHLFAFLEAAKSAGIPKVAIHIFTDGRDTPPQSAAQFIRELEETLSKVGIGFIASISGRFFAMDRDNNWNRLSKVEKALFKCEGNVCTVQTPSDFVEEMYKEGKFDEHIEPIVCLDEQGKGCAIEKNDGVFFFNFRPDRARMLSMKILEKAQKENLCFVTLTEYNQDFTEAIVAYPPIKIETTLGDQVAKAGLTQAHIAETEKYPHATYFLNGGRETPYEQEIDILAPSRKDVPTHDLAPEMKTAEIADRAIEQIEAGVDFMFINFANPDMVGHTAKVPAIITAIETVDQELGRVVEALKAKGGVALITADHGNAEINVDPITKEPHTSHTNNPVPVIFTDTTKKIDYGSLADVAPTILALLNIEKPPQMTGKNLLS